MLDDHGISPMAQSWNRLAAVALSLAGVVVILFAIVWLVTGGVGDIRRGLAKRWLIAREAPRTRVLSAFPPHSLTDYSTGTSARQALEPQLATDARLARIREKAAHYPGVLHHTTMWTQTWLFLDADDKLRDWEVDPQ